MCIRLTLYVNAEYVNAENFFEYLCVCVYTYFNGDRRFIAVISSFSRPPNYEPYHPSIVYILQKKWT